MARLIDEGMIAQLSKKQGYFLKYFPARIRNVGEDAKEDRKLIYAFKDARDDAYKLVAQMVDGYLKREYGEQVKDMVFLCVPASRQEVNKSRYKEFCKEVSRLSGIKNGYSHLILMEDRLAVHERRRGREKEISKVSIMDFDKPFFKGKQVLIFDDIITTGGSYAIFKDAVKYYEKLDTYPLYPSLKTTLAAYGKLLSSATSFKQGDELMNFIALEDKCFRSLMKYLAQVDTETLQKLTMGTTRVFDGLYSSVGAQVDDVNDRTMLYLSMRFNRRIIQNALACKEDILSRRRLGNTQQANYRWMLIQPFMAIDDYSAAVLTEEQREQLLALSDDLPGLLERLDARKHVRDKENNLTEVLTTEENSLHWFLSFVCWCSRWWTFMQPRKPVRLRWNGLPKGRL